MKTYQGLKCQRSMKHEFEVHDLRMSDHFLFQEFVPRHSDPEMPRRVDCVDKPGGRYRPLYSAALEYYEMARAFGTKMPCQETDLLRPL